LSVQQLASRNGHISSPENCEGDTFTRVIAKRRLLGFDAGDWSVLIAGIILVALLVAYL
jgi:hypothetical protein